MSGRQEVSTTLQDPNVEPASSAMASIALIGPNATHRRVMANALAGSEPRAVREFIDYPVNLGDVPHLMEENFDVVMIDVDSDQSYALQIITSIAAYNTSVVMAYSMRNDPDLIRDCMAAGARDFLPLPEDASLQAEPYVEPELEAELVPAPEPEPESQPRLELVPDTKAASEPAVNPADFLRKPEPEVAPEEDPLDPKDFLLATPRVVPESEATAAFVPQQYIVPSRPQFVEPRRPASTPAPAPPVPAPTHSAPPAPVHSAHPAPVQPAPEARRPEPPQTHHVQPEELRRPEPGTKPVEGAAVPEKKDDAINEWDSLWIHPALVAAGKMPADAAVAQASEPKAQKKAAIQSGPVLVQRANTPAAAVEPEPIASAPLFSALSDPDAAADSQRPWTRWAIIGGAALVVIALLVMVFRPSHHPAPAAPQETAVAQPVTPAVVPAAVQAKPSPKPSAASPAAAETQQAAAAPVSSAMMDAQLNAPTRIAGSLNKSSQEGEEPPSGFAPSGMDTGTALPNQVFGGSGMKVMPSVSAISAGVAEGMLVHRTSPSYPEIAKSAHVSGTVVLGANITKTGSLTNLHILSGPAMLRSSAMDAVKTWRYRPYLLNNQPVEVGTTIRVVFTLDR